MCLYPRLLRNPKYTSNKKNGGVIPPIKDTRVLVVPIGCGECMECMRQKQNQWKTRLLEDIKENKNGKFVTLTFSNQQYANIAKEFEDYKGYFLDNKIAVTATRRFLERWRKQYGKSVRHFFITELGHGETEHLHMHGIIWTDQTPETIAEIWGYGYVWPRKSYSEKEPWKGTYVNGETIGYISKYITKRDFQHRYYKPKILCSAGLGEAYIRTHAARMNEYKGEETQENYRLQNGNRCALPIYYRNKIYDDEQKEELWINKIEKEVRWVNGQKIEARGGWYEYFKALKSAQVKNIELGYGKGEKDWNDIDYEQKVRILNQKKRIYEKDTRKSKTNSKMDYKTN